jgi:hypothetical protein
VNDLTAIGARPIRQPDARSLVEAVRITLTIFALATPFFGYMALSAAHVQEEYRLSRLVEHHRQLVKENERLLLGRDALLSPQAVSKAAREKLGMVEEDAQEWTVGVPPEKDRAGEPGSRGAGDKDKDKDKNKVQATDAQGASHTKVAAPAKPPSTEKATDSNDKPKPAKAKPHGGKVKKR